LSCRFMFVSTTCFFSTQCWMECNGAKRTAIPLAPPGMIDVCVCLHRHGPCLS
jgi:hypothetical protein